MRSFLGLSRLPAAVIILAVAAGGSLYGVAGAYLAIPVVAVISAVFSSFDSEGNDQAGDEGEASA